MALNISGLEFFAPVWAFLFVFVVVYALLAKTKIIGESKFINLAIGFILASIFIAFSSIELFIRTLVPWFVVLIVVLFFVMLIVGLATKDMKEMYSFLGNKFVWAFIVLLVVVFFISSLYVFNPIFHPSLGLAPGYEGESVLTQLGYFLSGSGIAGSILLIIIAIIVAWVITRK